MKLGEIIAVVIFLLIPLLIGWGLNIYKLTQCNFEPSYKAETIRGIGVFVAPVGAITGYMEIKDKE